MEIQLESADLISVGSFLVAEVHGDNPGLLQDEREEALLAPSCPTYREKDKNPHFCSRCLSILF